MQTLLVYLLKATVYSGILFSYYYVALRNKRFHYYNRFYLLMSVALSLFLPFVNLEVWTWRSQNEQVIQMMNVMLVNSSEVSTEGSRFYLSPETIVFTGACFVSVCLLLFLAFSIIKIFRFKRNYPSEKIDAINFITTDLHQAPFSFFNNLFWKNTIDISDITGRQILRHEMTHIQHKHSCDKVFMRIVTAVFWLNPFYWLMQKELSMIHEFIADEKAIENKDAEAFALMLLQSQYAKAIFSPAQSFHYSPIKRRLLMLTTSKKPSFSYARRILVLPLLAATVLLFAFKMRETKNITLSHVNAPFVLVVDAGHGGSDKGAPGANNALEKSISLSIAKKIQQLAPEYGITVAMTRTDDATVSFEDRLNFIKSRQPDAFISIHINATAEKQTSKNEVEVYITRDEAKSSYNKSRLLGSGLLQALQNNFPIIDTLQQRKNHGIFIIDQNPYPAAIIECGYMNNAESVKQLTNDNKVETLARDILQGVVNFSNAKQQSATVTIMDTTGKTPLYYVDGKEISEEEMKKIEADKMESIDVLKDSSAIKKYGEKGKSGVVEIKMKKANALQDETNDQFYRETATKNITLLKVVKKNDTVPKNSSNSDKSIGMKLNPTDSSLIVVDGKIMPNRNELDMLLPPDDIISMTVLKGESALRKYGEKGSHGVVEITTKHNTKGKQLLVVFSPPKIVKDTEIIDRPTNSNLPKKNEATFTKAQTPPSFPGGKEAWEKYLQKQLRFNTPAEHKAPTGNYTVIVEFKVDNKGNLSDFKALTNPGFGTAEEAIRVIQRGPKWIPAKQSGYDVTAITKQAITFMVVEN